jgi:hypothetical protein
MTHISYRWKQHSNWEVFIKLICFITYKILTLIVNYYLPLFFKEISHTKNKTIYFKFFLNWKIDGKRSQEERISTFESSFPFSHVAGLKVWVETLRLHLHSLHTGFGKRTKSYLYRSGFANDIRKLFIVLSDYQTRTNIYKN